jgi:hypothetical protein
VYQRADTVLIAKPISVSVEKSLRELKKNMPNIVCMITLIDPIMAVVNALFVIVHQNCEKQSNDPHTTKILTIAKK